MRFFATSCLLALAISVFTTDTVQAQDRQVLGYGRLFNNDYFGDNKDRWRTGSYALSQVRGYEWNGERPTTFGEIIEFRFRSEIIAPNSLTTPNPTDRKYVGAFSFGVHTHFQRGGFDFAVGGDVVTVGPQTGLGAFQETIHELVGAPVPLVLDDQVENAMQLAGTLEISRNYKLSETIMLRPFIEAQVGAEDILRIGGDFVLGRVVRDDLLIRDVSTGQLYRGTEAAVSGFSFVVGADYAMVGDSIYLPDTGPAALDNRTRGRAGIHWQMAEDTSFFYGVTYLSEEFEGQTEGQYVGSLKLNFNF